jgi:hypothetical protein
MEMKTVLLLVLVLCSLLAHAAEKTYDVVIYGGTSGAITAAVQAKSMGKDVIVISPDRHLGGLTSGGLGWTDSGNKAVIGGLSAEFYHRIWRHYQKPESWTQPKPDRIRDQGDGSDMTGTGLKAMWTFEPHVAEAIYDAWMVEMDIPLVRDAWLDRERGVVKEGGRIVSITTLDGETYAGRMFIDATYEGDLMAAAGVDYHVGRESQDTYGEEWNGVQTGVFHHGHHFQAVSQPIDPYVVPGDPSSGVLPRISTQHPGEKGAGDDKVQAYCFRMCLTNVEENRLPFPKPDGYDADQYLLLLRILDAGWREVFNKFDPVPNGKTDTNKA